MKVMSLISAICLAGFCMAAPKLEWVPANPDVVVTALNMDKEEENAKVNAVWEKAFASIGMPFAELKNESLPENIEKFLKTIGIDPKSDKSHVSSLVCSITWRSTSEPQIIAVLETKMLEAKNFEKALVDLAKDEPAVKDKMSVTKKGKWTVVAHRKLMSQNFAFRQGQGFIVVTAEADIDAADALLAKKAPCMAATDPLAETLKAVTPRAEGHAMLRDFAALVKTMVGSEEEYAQLSQRTPILTKIHQVTQGTTIDNAANVQINFVLQTSDVAAAQELRDTFTMYKMLGLQGLQGSGMIAADSKVLEVFRSIKIGDKDSSTTVALALTPNTFAQLVKEMKDRQAKEAAADASTTIDFGDDDDENSSLTPEEAMTVEEAQKILDGLN